MLVGLSFGHSGHSVSQMQIPEDTYRHDALSGSSIAVRPLDYVGMGWGEGYGDVVGGFEVREENLDDVTDTPKGCF